MWCIPTHQSKENFSQPCILCVRMYVCMYCAVRTWTARSGSSLKPGRGVLRLLDRSLQKSTRGEVERRRERAGEQGGTGRGTHACRLIIGIIHSASIRFIFCISVCMSLKADTQWFRRTTWWFKKWLLSKFNGVIKSSQIRFLNENSQQVVLVWFWNNNYLK